MRNISVKKILFLGILALVIASPAPHAHALVELEINCGIDASGNSTCSNGNSTNTRGLTCENGVCTYTPLEPVSGFEQTGAQDFGSFLKSIFRILFSISALIAVGMLTVGGIEYMVSEVAHRKNEGLRRAQAAIYGILILAGSWLILNTINPRLLEFNFNVGGSSGSAPSGVSQPRGMVRPTADQEAACREMGGSLDYTEDGRLVCR